MAPSEAAGPSTARKAPGGAQWLTIEEVVVFLAVLAANESAQSQKADDREAKAKEFYIAYIRQIDELGLWTPGRSGTQQPKTVEDSIRMRTGDSASTGHKLINRFNLVNSGVHKVRTQMAKVQQASGNTPPSGNNNIYTYWRDSADAAKLLLDGKEAQYLDHFSYVCPDSWRFDE